jgi:excisionase family DNA binding protein
MGTLTSTHDVLWETGIMSGDLLTTAEAAKALRVSLATLQRWVTAGTVTPTLRLPGGRFRWDLDDLKRQLRKATESADGS